MQQWKYTTFPLRIPYLLPLLALFSCGSPSTRQENIDLASAASVTGRVVFTGVAPRPDKLDLSANPTCERQHLRPVYSETVLVKNGGLRNVLVYVKSGLPTHRWSPPATSARLNQEGCIYQPHVLALMTGQTLEVSNSDPLNHNVHAEASVNEAFNIAQPPRAEKLFRHFEHPEIMIPVTCGVHPWMRAYVSVFDHPFFAVTDEEGRFRIEGLPPAAYALEAVHEIYGRQQAALTLRSAERQTLDFTYNASSR